MKLAMIGLGRMGGNMAKRLLRGGHEVVVYNRTKGKAVELIKAGATLATTVSELKILLPRPRIVWIMVPAGAPTEENVEALTEILAKGDVIVDGGNSYYKDDVRRANILAAKGIHYVDAGVSGGVWGLERGYSLMVGGSEDAFTLLDPILRTLAPGRGDLSPSPGRSGDQPADDGFLHCGPVGAGHFVKMIHNGIEYGMMQALAEGFDILRNATSESLPVATRYDFDLGEIAEVWRRGSVVSSWLLDLIAMALARDPGLTGFEGIVNDSGEGRWAIQAAIEESVSADVLSASLFNRFRSRQTHTYADKILSAMRFGFGAHQETPR